MKTLYVVGNSRSGTTMMGRILGQHPDVFTFGELHFFEYLWNPASASAQQWDPVQLVARLLTIQRDGFYKQGNIAPNMPEAQALISALPSDVTPPCLFHAFLKYETQRNGKSIACDQTPRNVFYIGEILDYYPDAFIINMIRDPRDVLLSQKNKWRRRALGLSNMPAREVARSWANYHPVTTSLLWNGAVRAGDRYSEHQRVLQVRFEDVLREPELWIRRICSFAQLDFSPAMLNVPQKGSSHRPDAPDKLGIDAAAAGRWTESAGNREDLAICQRVTRTLLVEHNYMLEQIDANPVRLAGAYATWPVKSALALGLNVNRTRSVLQTLRKRLTR